MENIENRRKRLIFRSWHRGTREMDLIMGSFADTHVPGMDEDRLAQYEEILHMADPDVYDWVSRQKPVPANVMTPVLQQLIDFDYGRASPAKNDDAKL
jgi:antitoxin CptB